MKYIKFVTVMIIWFLGHQINAQTNCIDQVKTTTSTSTLWNWRTDKWQVNYRTTGGPPVYLGDLLSPFWDDQNSNTKPLADVDSLNKDNKPEDGWELISKNMGMGLSQGDAVASIPSAPYVLLYNKNTAKLRIYLLVVQLFSGVANNDASTGGTIKVRFLTSLETDNLYQSNLLTTNTSPMLPLDKFTRDLNIVTPNAFRNTVPYWLYADIPVAYDPCTCLNKGQIRIEAYLNNNAQVNLDIVGVPRSSPINNNQTNVTGSDFLTGFSEVSGKINGGLKAAATVAGTVKEFKKGLGKSGILTSVQYANIDRDIKAFEGLADQGTALLKLIPQYGEAISSIVSFVDYFVSGGKSSKGATPSGVVIMNDFKATGTITSTNATNAVSVLIPGSDSQGTSSSLIPKYNNTLGVFNLLRTPIANTKRLITGNVEMERDTRECIWDVPGSWYHKYLDLYVQLDPNTLNEAVSYVINPAVYPDAELSDIKAAIQISGIGQVDGGNMITETVTKGPVLFNGQVIPVITNLYRTEYYPIGQIGEVTAHLKARLARGWVPDPSYNFCSFSDILYDYSPTITLKIVARIKRKNTTKPEEDIIFIATYPLSYDIAANTLDAASGYTGDMASVSNITQAPANAYNNPDLSDMVLRGQYNMLRGFNGRYGYPNLEVIKKKNIILENGRIFAGAGALPGWGPYPQSILTQGYSITMTNDDPNNDFVIETTAGDIVFEVKNTAYQAPVSATNVYAFCNSTDYKVASRNQSKTVETQAETPKDTPVASPKATQLLSIYPNPTTDEATITYEVDKEGSSVSIYLTNNLGIRVMEVSNEASQAQGTHNVRIDTRTLAAGVYFYTLVLNGVAYTERLVVIK